MEDRILSFFRNKKVLITGHTGFKGSWLCNILLTANANVTGFALAPSTVPNIFQITQLEKRMNSRIGDIRNLEQLMQVFQEIEPEIVIHMAAQPLVRVSYKEPLYTYETNIMGTVNILECIRNTKSVKSFLNVTTDKVYKNKEWIWGYRENEELDGFDPYSNSKSCSELITHSYKSSFFCKSDIGISTARAGNVIGGGDYSEDRIIPDCIRAANENKEIIVRNPHSVRPYQHVLEPLFAYLLIIKTQYGNNSNSDWYNVGPDDVDCYSTGELVDLFCNLWNEKSKHSIHWINKNDGGPHEANFLKLDCSKIKTKLNWRQKWNIPMAMEKIVEWHNAYNNDENMIDITRKQILEYINTIK